MNDTSTRKNGIKIEYDGFTVSLHAMLTIAAKILSDERYNVDSIYLRDTRFDDGVVIEEGN